MSNASAAARRCHQVLLAAAAGIAFAASLTFPAAAQRASAVTELNAVAPTVMLYWGSLKYAEQAAAMAAAEAAPAAGTTPVSEAQPVAERLADAAPAGAYSEAERQCLATAVYYESRGDTKEGQRAVADVIVRRTRTKPFPDTICGVVSQKVGRTCQFTYACNGKLAKPYAADWKLALEAADYELTGAGRDEDLTGSATFFHAARIKTNWKARYVMTRQVGAHVFYRMTDKSMRAYKNKLPAR